MKFVFLSYLNRSGSTYLANFLSRSTEICVCPEAEILYNLFLTHPNEKVSQRIISNYSEILESNNKFNLWKIGTENVFNESKTNLQNFLNVLKSFQEQHCPNADIILFKHNYLINLAGCNYSDNSVFFINLLRDPKSVFASQKTTVSPTTGNPMCKNALSFSESWNIFNQKINNLKSKNAISIRFEDLITDTDRVMDHIFEFIGCNYSWQSIRNNQPQLGKWISDEYKSIHQNIDDKPKPEVNEKWKNILLPKELIILSKYLNAPGNYTIPEDVQFRWFHRFYEFYLRAERKITYMQGILREKRLQNKIDKIC